MSIAIDASKCIGCGRCSEVCPGNLIKVEETSDPKDKKAEISRPQECWGCCSCIKECPRQAIRFFLGADVGGRGAYMVFAKKHGINFWMINRPDGTTETIEVDPKNANKY